MNQNSKPPHFHFTDVVGNFDGAGALFEQSLKNKDNLRDHAPLEQLVVLTNLESLNSVLIRQGRPPHRFLSDAVMATDAPESRYQDTTDAHRVCLAARRHHLAAGDPKRPYIQRASNE
jgi:hypothetical protein